MGEKNTQLSSLGDILSFLLQINSWTDLLNPTKPRAIRIFSMWSAMVEAVVMQRWARWCIHDCYSSKWGRCRDDKEDSTVRENGMSMSVLGNMPEVREWQEQRPREGERVSMVNSSAQHTGWDIQCCKWRHRK